MSITKHTAYNLAGALVPLAVSLLTIPLYLKVIGLERYGVLSVCWLVLGYFGLFDLGLGRATAQKIASLVHGTDAERSEIFWTAFALSVALSILAALLILPTAYVVLNFMRTGAIMNHELGHALPWLAASIPVALLTGILSGALTGRQRFGFTNLVDGASNLFMSVAPLALAWQFGPELWILIAAALATRVLAFVVLLGGCFRWVPLRRPKMPSAAMSKSMAGYGGWVSVSSAVGPILSSWDRIAIGGVLGAAAVATYVVPFTLIGRVTLIPASLSAALFPRFASSSGLDARDLKSQGVGALSVVMTPIVLLAMIVVGPFLIVWVGPKFAAEATNVAYILLPGIWLNSFAHLAFSVLQAQGRPKIVAKIHLAEVLPYLAVLQMCMVTWGLDGVALAWTIRASADALLLFGFSSGVGSLRKLLPQAAVILAATGVAVALPAELLVKSLLLTFCFVLGTFLSFRSSPETFSRILLHMRTTLGLGPKIAL